MQVVEKVGGGKGMDIAKIVVFTVIFIGIMWFILAMAFDAYREPNKDNSKRKSDDIQKALNTVDIIKNKIDLDQNIAEIAKEIILKDKDKFLEDIPNQNNSIEISVYKLILNIMFRDLCMNNGTHIYRGVLNFYGMSLKKSYIMIMQHMKKIGFINDNQYKLSIQNLEERINEVG